MCMDDQIVRTVTPIAIGALLCDSIFLANLCVRDQINVETVLSC